MRIVTLGLVLCIYVNDASGNKLISSHANNDSMNGDFQQSFQRLKRTEFRLDLVATEYSLLVAPIRMGDSVVEKRVMLDTSLSFSWIASNDLLSQYGFPAIPGFGGMKVLRENECYQYSRYQLTGDWCEARLHVGHRGRVDQFRFLFVKSSNERIKFLNHVNGVIGLGPGGTGGMSYIAQTQSPRRSYQLLISYNSLKQAKVQFTRLARQHYPPGAVAFDRVSDDRWSIYVDSISVGATMLCTEQCELSFELGCARAYVPEDKRGLIAGEWNVPVVEGAMELQESQLYLYEPLKVKVQSMEFDWPPYGHHFTYTERRVRKYQSTILAHDSTYYALGTDYLYKMLLVFDVNAKKIHVAVNNPTD